MLPFSLPGFEIHQVGSVLARLSITATANSKTSMCPACQHVSHRVHSYYVRSPQDLPVSGQPVQLILRVRRFRCQNRSCLQQTFVERLPEVVPFYARRTKRLLTLHTLVASALGGQTGEQLLEPLGMGVSAETLLRDAKKAVLLTTATPSVLGVDDFAFRRGRTYGTILVDLEQHRPIDLLADRTAETFAKWLREHPGVKIISRDRSTEYTRGASDGAPQAQQVADRWHILKNLREAAERALKRVHAELIEQQATATLPQAPQYKRRRSQTEIATTKVARFRRQARYAEVVALYKQGMSVLGIADQLRMSRSTVRNFVYAGAFPERATTLRAKSLLDPYVPYLEKRLAQGCRNANKLWEEIQKQGFTGGYKLVNRWLEPRREKPGRKHSLREKDMLGVLVEEEAGTHSQQLKPKPEPLAPLDTLVAPAEIALESPHHLVWLLLRDPSELDELEQRTLSFLEENPVGKHLADLVQSFVKLLRKRDVEALDPWLERSMTSGIPDMESFAQGLQKDYSAIRAAFTLKWSNGQVEGQVNRLKFIKRSMYGRGSFELLRQRVLNTA
jgi:transposase